MKEILQEIRRNCGLDSEGNRINYSANDLVVYTTKELSDRDIVEAKSK